MILLLAEGVRSWLGNSGLYVLAGASGISDVDAITLSVSRLSVGQIPVRVALIAIFTAATVNSFVKSGMSIVIGGKRLGSLVAAALIGVIVVGAVLLWVSLASAGATVL